MTFPSRLSLIAALAAIGWLAAASVAAAQPPLIKVHAVKIGRHAVAHDRPHCRTVFTFGRRGQTKKIVCDRPGAHRAGPRFPPYHGHGHAYRKPAPQPQRHLFWQNKAPWHYQVPHVPAHAARTPSRCDTGLVAGIIGGAAGALAGSQVGSGNGQIASTAIGTLVGTIAGLGIGETLDRACLASALEYAPDRHTVRWQPPASPAAPWHITPSTTWQGEDGRYCREFTSTAIIGNQPQSIYGRACRQPDGAWEIVS